MEIGYVNLPCPTCADNCEDNIAIPPVQSNRCIQAWDIRKSEGRTIYIAPIPADGKTEAPLTHAEMQTMADNPDVLLGKIDNEGEGGLRCLCGVWDLGEPEEETFEFKGQTIVTDRTWTLNFDTIDVNDTNYDFARQISSCPITACIAFDNDGGSFFGWAVATISATYDMQRGSESLETIKLKATWKALCLPPRYTAIPVAA